MATGTIPLRLRPPDGSASNAAPRFLMQKGTNSAPVRFIPVWSFDPSTQQHVWATEAVPTNYLSGGSIRLVWAANATTNAVKWGASIGYQTATASDSYLAHAQATAVTATTNVPATTARRPVETLLSMAGNLDSLAANGVMYVVIYRVAADAADTCTVDAELIAATFDYTM